jgi:hypothetical protein
MRFLGLLMSPVSFSDRRGAQPVMLLLHLQSMRTEETRSPLENGVGSLNILSLIHCPNAAACYGHTIASRLSRSQIGRVISDSLNR